MKCPNEIRACPHSWSNCELCANLKACEAGTYTAELEDHELETDLGIAIEEVLPVVQAVPEVVESVAKIRGTWAEQFLKMSPNDRMKEFMRYHPPSLHHKEPIPLDGGSSPGGGSKSKNHKKPQRKVPEYMKILGM